MSSTRELFHASNGDDEATLLAYCEGCAHFGESGEDCHTVWLELDLGNRPPQLTVADIHNNDIQCTERRP